MRKFSIVIVSLFVTLMFAGTSQAVIDPNLSGSWYDKDFSLNWSTYKYEPAGEKYNGQTNMNAWFRSAFPIEQMGIHSSQHWNDPSRMYLEVWFTGREEGKVVKTTEKQNSISISRNGNGISARETYNVYDYNDGKGKGVEEIDEEMLTSLDPSIIHAEISTSAYVWGDLEVASAEGSFYDWYNEEGDYTYYNARVSWQLYSPTGASLANLGGIDKVVGLTAVPEPASMGMLACATGLVLRRRRQM